VQYIDIGDEQLYALDDEEHIRELTSKKITLIHGWLYRDEVSRHKFADQIRSYFTPQPHHLQRIGEVVTKARSTCDVLVGVHVRLGDYATFMNGRYHYSLTTYRDIMTKVRRLFPGKIVGFLICSNEPIDLSLFAGLNVKQGPNHLVQDMYSFSQCDYLIGPPSTYTVWASYYGNVPLLQIATPFTEPTLVEFAVY
jgi:hypothetical protein